MKEELFRFVVLRAAEPHRGETTELAAETVLQASLAKAGGNAKAVEAALRHFQDSPAGAPQDSKEFLMIATRVQALDAALLRQRPMSSPAVRELLDAHYPDRAKDSARPGWASVEAWLCDWLLVHGLSRTPVPGDAARLARCLRLMRLIRRLEAEPSLPDAAVTALLFAPLRFPQGLASGAPPVLTDTPPEPASEPIPTVEAGKVGRIALALAELARLPASSFAVAEAPRLPPRKGEVISVSSPDPLASLRLSPRGIASLSEATSTVLAELGLKPKDESVPRLQVELRHARTQQLLRFSPELLGRWVLRGGVFLAPSAPTTPELPRSVGMLRRLGVGELLVVRQELRGYVEADLAHIENVMPGEARVREHRRRRTVEEFYSEEKERSEAEEKEFGATDRFELSSEVAETVREEFSVRGGLRVKASYGPVVEVEANAEAGYESSSERSRKTASQVGREVVQKSVSRLEEKVRTLRSTRTTEEVEERNSHTLTNPEATPRRGMYQFVTKRYEARTFNYGLREMYEFDVPEPGAYLLRALKEDLAAVSGLKEPDVFTLRPDDIADVTYQRHAADHGATADVEPPPPDWVIRTCSFTHEDLNEENRPAGLAQQAEIQVGEGWEAVACKVVALHHGGQFFCTVGPHIFDFTESSGVQECLLGTEDGVAYPGALKVGAIGIAPRNVLVTVHVFCRPTARAHEAWRLRTYSAIRTAHERQVQAYEDALAARSVARGVKLPERGAEEAHRLLMDELKKACISIATAQHFDAFGAVETDGAMRPQVALASAAEQGPYVRFFEQAFEWENLQYVAYPYFWGRKSTWEERVRMPLGADPAFTEFLRAGGARVVVPVREGFAAALEHFKRTGRVFGGD
ncbi:hypothetical protein, partial [Corallococcus exiguus]